jgi:hypothetical protein
MVNKDKKMMLLIVTVEKKKREKSHERPFPADAQIKQVNKIHHVYDGEGHVVFDAVLFESLADHDAKVGQQSRREEKQKMNVKKCIVGLFILRQFFIAEQQ